MADVITIGLELRRARRVLGLRIDEPAAELCICRTYLEALEADEFSALPNPAYAIGYLRSYADFLGLSPEPLVRELKEQATPEPVEHTPIPVVKPRRNRFLPVASFAASLALVVSALYFGWDAVRGGHDRASMVPELPANLAALLTDEPEEIIEAPAALLADGGEAYFEALLPEEGETVRILAVSDVPVLVVDAEGAVVREGVFYAGESLELAKDAGFKVMTPEVGALVFFISNAPSNVTALEAGGLFRVSLDELQPGIEDPIPAS